MTKKNLINSMDKFTRAYIEAALWATTGDDGEPLDANYDVNDFSIDALKQIIEDCKFFQEAEHFMLVEAGNPEQNGHDFFLTRNRHGAGFWDRGYEQVVSGQLTKASNVMGESEPYVGASGKLYV